MCGRFTELTDPNQFGFTISGWKPRYNIAPTMPLFGLRCPADSNLGQPESCQFRWGLIPSWAKDIKVGYRMINARSETINEKPSFRSAFKSRRCAILADGFYEWKTVDKGKQTMYFRNRDLQPFWFLGLWESWMDPKSDSENAAIESCTIITKEADELTRPYHHRMPCRVDVESPELDRWLDPESQDVPFLKELLGRCSGEGMEAMRVSSYVNKVGHDGPQCIDVFEDDERESNDQ